jgi:CRP-like cAMP-binding protein
MIYVCRGPAPGRLGGGPSVGRVAWQVKRRETCGRGPRARHHLPASRSRNDILEPCRAGARREERLNSPREAEERILRSVRLFAGVAPELRAELAGGASRRMLSRGERVWLAGDEATRFTVILSGLVEIVRRGADGAEAIVALFGPRESIGDAAVLAQGTFPADARVASARAEVLQVAAAPVLEAMERQPEVARAMNEALLAHTRALQEKIRIMSAGAVPQRLATLLLHLAERFGDEDDTGATFVPVALSRSELASLVGARVETTIRAVSRWRKAGVLATPPEGFAIRDLEALRRIARGK